MENVLRTPASCSCLLPLPSPPRRGSRALLRWTTNLHDPQSTMHIVKVDQSVVRLRAPGERKIRTIPRRIAVPKPAILGSRPVKIAAQFARDIDDASATV